MGEREKEFRQRIGRITRIQKLNSQLEEYVKEEMDTQEVKQNNLSEILPAICKVKKNIENFRTKESKEEIKE